MILLIWFLDNINYQINNIMIKLNFIFIDNFTKTFFFFEESHLVNTNVLYPLPDVVLVIVYYVLY